MTTLVHTTYGLSPMETKGSNTLLSALHHPQEFCKLSKDKHLILCDYNSMSGAIEFAKACKDNGIRPVIGCTFLDERRVAIRLVAKNKDGYIELLKLISRSNDPDRFDKGPVLKLSDIPKTDNLISLIGGIYSRPLQEDVDTHREIFSDVFGIHTGCSKDELVSDLGLPIFKMNDAHILDEKEIEDFKLILCVALKCKLKNLNKVLREGNAEFLSALGSFVRESDSCDELFNLIEDYEILAKPSLPKYKWTDGLSEEEYLLKTCREAYPKRKLDYWDQNVYGQHVKDELKVIQDNGLVGYFLIVWDYIKWAKERMLVGPSRGSSAGSIVAYLLGITEPDPIKFDLLFSRFYNEGRNTGDHVEYPDIDTDFPPDGRESVIEYVRNKYGADRVAQVATYGRMLGASILKEVLSAHGMSSFQQINEMTKFFPNEADIESDLKELEKSGKRYSIIQWVLENQPDLVRDWCEYKDGKYTGEYGVFFEQAIRLEGTFKTQGKHAAGVVISPVSLQQVCPMLHDKGGDNKIAGMDMDSLKKAGIIKFDFLGLNSLQKIERIFKNVSQKFNLATNK